MTDAFDPYVPEMIETRRRIHARPELGWTEFETTAIAAERLESLGFEVHLGREVVNPETAMGRNDAQIAAAVERARQAGVPEELLARMDGITGALGVIRTGRPGPVVAYRFDMDALPIQESADPSHQPAAEGFASAFPGIMHACGHDAHTAVGLGFARWLADHRDELRGTVKLLFQPAEEGTRGAAGVVGSGCMDGVDWFFASHAGTVCRTGELGLCRDVYLATAKFDADFTGVASHAGEDPEKGRSALIAATNAVLMLNAIPRSGQGMTRISVGRLTAGEARNITPVHAHMELEVRGGTHEANRYMCESAVRVIEGCAATAGVDVKITKVGEATTLPVNEEAIEVMREAAEAVPGASVRELNEKLASEDCTLISRHVAGQGGRCGFFIFGCEHKGHHRPDFDVQDRVNLKPALEVFAGIARRLSMDSVK